MVDRKRDPRSALIKKPRDMGSGTGVGLVGRANGIGNWMRLCTLHLCLLFHHCLSAWDQVVVDTIYHPDILWTLKYWAPAHPLHLMHSLEANQKKIRNLPQHDSVLFHSSPSDRTYVTLTAPEQRTHPNTVRLFGDHIPSPCSKSGSDSTLLFHPSISPCLRLLCDRASPRDAKPENAVPLPLGTARAGPSTQPNPTKADRVVMQGKIRVWFHFISTWPIIRRGFFSSMRV